MAPDIDQDDIDKLLADALGGMSDDSESGDDGVASQDDIDALIAAAAGGGIPDNQEEADDTPPDAEDEGPASQDDIDALIAAASGSASSTQEAEDEGPASQDDIDALIAAAGGGASDDAEEEDEGPASQDDIDALIAAAGGGASDDAEEEDEGPAGQDDIDALIAATGSGASDDAEEEDEGPAGQDDIDALIAAAGSGGDITGGADDGDEEDAWGGIEDTAGDDTDSEDIDSLASTATFDAIPEPSPSSPMMEEEAVADTASAPQAKPRSAPTPPPPAPERHAPAASFRPAPPQSAPLPLEEEAMQSIRESLSLMQTSGEVENIAGQISGLLGQLSERARRYQGAWMGVDQEAKDLRTHLSQAQHAVHVLEAEKEGLENELFEIRKRVSRIEGEKLAAAEAHRTERAALELAGREQESRIHMLQSENRSLKEELERARTDATGSDLEGRRARFEAERLSQELLSERQERQRLQRALENREKELQAMQAQAAGHASTLFLDELHRLVRRLESELDIRTRAAQEALNVLDKMRVPPEMDMQASTLRAAVASAAGVTMEEHDALRHLSRGEDAPTGPRAAAETPGGDSFEKALVRHDFAKASMIASASLRTGERTPAQYMRIIHDTEALRRPDMVEHLDELIAMLRGLKDLQDASDRARGRESVETEKLYTLMFNYLHSLVRQKLLTRGLQAPWSFFLDLRGRFSFLTSDRQWQEYRDKILAQV